MICDCGWKYPDSYSECPQCGKNRDTVDYKGGVGMSNRKTGSKPLKRKNGLNSKPIKPKQSDNKLQRFMRMVGLQMWHETGGHCMNCGFNIDYLKYGNVSHLKTRGSAPDKKTDPDNVELHCDTIDRLYETVDSCHLLLERNRITEFLERAKLYRDEQDFKHIKDLLT